MAMAAMDMMSTGGGGGSGASFRLGKCSQGVASAVLFKKTLTFGSRRSNLDHLTVPTHYIYINIYS